MAPSAAAQVPEVVPASTTRNVLAGFFLSGLLLSFVGAILPAWGYHLQPDYVWIGNYFLSLNAGLLLSVPLSRRAMARWSLRAILVVASSLAAVALFFLASVGPPMHPLWRTGGILVAGTSAGLLHSAVFGALSPVYRRDPAATVTLSGLLFGLGALTSALFVASAFYTYKSGSILFLMGVIPAFLAAHWARTRMVVEPTPTGPTLRTAWRDFQSPAAVLFALLLFFQFGNEWAVAGWIPLFLAQRLGISPATSLLFLGLYWFALIVGRFVSQAVLPRIHHGKLLLGSVIAAMLGCLILTFTNNQFGAGTGLVLVGGGFASIYPLVVEKIGDRFPYYHPGLFNGLFSLAVTGGLLAPASIGYVAHFFGIGVIMGLPAIGSVAVLVLLVVIWIEAKLSRAA